MKGGCGRIQKTTTTVHFDAPGKRSFSGKWRRIARFGRGLAFDDNQSYAIRTCVKPTQVAACYVVWGMARLERR